MKCKVRLVIKGPSDKVADFVNKRVDGDIFFLEGRPHSRKCSVGTFNENTYIEFSWMKPPKKTLGYLSRSNSSLVFEMCWYDVERIQCYNGSCIVFRNYGYNRICEDEGYEVSKDYRAISGDIVYYDEEGNVVDKTSDKIVKEVAAGRFARVLARVGLTYEHNL